MWGVRGRALSHPRPLVLSGVRPGRTTHWPWVRRGRAWGPVTNPTARALASWLCALWGRHEGARGGRLLPGCGASGDGRSPSPDLSSIRACGLGPLPTGCGCGGCGRGDPSPTPESALLRAGFARCGGGIRVPGGGASCLGVGRPGTGALPTPTSCPFGRAAGAHYPLAVGARGAGVGTDHQPHSAGSCELALRAVGAARERPGGAPLALVSGVRGRALSHPRPLVRSGVRPGPTTHCLSVGGLRAWGPVTNPPARALASWSCALWGQHQGTRGGRLLPGCGASGDGRSPTPDLSSVRACGRGPLPTGCGCGGCGRGDPSPTPKRALACCGGGMRVPGAGASCLAVGRPGSGTLPPPTTRPFGRAAGAHYPLFVGAGGAGVGTRHQPHSARSCELALRAVGAARGRPGGAPLALVWGVRGWALSHPRPLVRSGVRPGPTTHWLWMRGVRAWGPVTNPRARALASWLCALPGRHEEARGGRLLPGCGSSGDGHSPTPDLSSVGACDRGPLPTGCGCGGCGCGDPSPTPQRGLLRAGFARCGGGMRVPGGAPLAWLWGLRGRALSHPRPHVRSGVRPGPTTHWLWVRRVRAWRPVSKPKARSCVLWGRHEGARRGRLLPGCGASGVGHSTTPDHSFFRACGRGQLPTGCGCRGCGRGDPSLTPQRALLRAGFARSGGGTRAPGGGASCLGVGRPGMGALPPPTSRPFGRAAGAHYPLAVDAGGAGVGTHHQPQSARSCELALRGAGAA